MKTESHAERVATEVRTAMARRRVTQHALADTLHVSQAAVSRRLTGTVAFNVTELHIVAELLGVDAADLLAPAGASTERSAS